MGRMTTPLIDAHTHLTSSKEPVDVLVRRAIAAGVTRMCTVGDGVEEAEAALAVADGTHVWAACAVHPTKAAEYLDNQERLRTLVFDPLCVAVGETGIDRYWLERDERTAPIELQEEAFRWHIDLAVEAGKALMIHNREGDADVLRILDDSPRPKEVIFHCFSSSVETARAALDRGYVLSFAGNVTFKRNDELRAAAALAPAGQYLVETDAPYLTPVPHRGKPNEPAMIPHTAACLAEARGVDVAQVAREVSATFDRVYGLDKH